ncbi:hypothetical protein HYW73_01855 [Candidatus Nomurabacteria bacterium]|nr:hypothetical protein [Candidatus Nomurabacteria bacterium]
MEKIKQFVESDRGKDIFTVMIVILVGFGSFELGRLSKENSSSGIKIEYMGQEEALGENLSGNVIKAVKFAPEASSGSADNFGKNFFASSRGSKYYSLGCSGGKTIKQENRVYFATSDEAERAGYTLSASCN